MKSIWRCWLSAVFFFSKMIIIKERSTGKKWSEWVWIKRGVCSIQETFFNKCSSRRRKHFSTSILVLLYFVFFSWAGPSKALNNHHPHIESSGCDLRERSSQVLLKHCARCLANSSAGSWVFESRLSEWFWSVSSFQPDIVLLRGKQKHSRLFPALHWQKWKKKKKKTKKWVARTVSCGCNLFVFLFVAPPEKWGGRRERFFFKRSAAPLKQRNLSPSTFRQTREKNVQNKIQSYYLCGSQVDWRRWCLMLRVQVVH